MGTWFTDAWDSVVIFSPITPNANFVETHMFLEFQNNRHDTEFENSFSTLELKKYNWQINLQARAQLYSLGQNIR